MSNFFGGQFFGGGFFGGGTPTPQAPVGGGVRKKRRIYLERDKQILLFESQEQLNAYLDYEQSREVKRPKKAKQAKQVKQVKPVKPVVVDLPKLQEYVVVTKQPENVFELLESRDYEILLDIYDAYTRWLDEQDVEVILLLH